MNLAHCKTLFALFSLLFLCVYSSEYNRFNYGARLVPHPKKAHKGGEDAFFANKNILAVADGVSFWNKEGIDPSKYSKELCRLIEVVINEGNKTIIDKPKEMIREVVKRNKNDGTSTLVIANLYKRRPILKTSYVGDSTYVIYRKVEGAWKIIFEAEGQQHKFNYPYQLGYKRATHPNKAAEFVHEVQDKDIVVVASDGIFDNLDSEQVWAELVKFIDAKDELKNPQEAAYNLTEAAFKLSINKKYNSPFAQKAVADGRKVMGGKSDDITIIIGQVRLAGASKIVKKELTRNETKTKNKIVPEKQVESSNVIQTVGFVALVALVLSLAMVKKSLDMRKKTTAEKKR